VADIVASTNAQRAANGLAPLAVSVCDTQQIEARVARLVVEGKFEHYDLQPLLGACNLRGVAENLALGYRDGAAVVDGWMNSPGHRTNLLGNYTHMGISCQKQDGRWLCGAIYSRS
jgi:uncharacterized protein YkwD